MCVPSLYATITYNYNWATQKGGLMIFNNPWRNYTTFECCKALQSKQTLCLQFEGLVNIFVKHDIATEYITMFSCGLLCYQYKPDLEYQTKKSTVWLPKGCDLLLKLGGKANI